jgi:hypothetical protein
MDIALGGLPSGCALLSAYSEVAADLLAYRAVNSASLSSLLGGVHSFMPVGTPCVCVI